MGKRKKNAGGKSMPDNKIRPRMRLFLSSDSIEGLFGSGKWQLLSAIRTEGSLLKAAARLNRSYRKAWGDIKVAEQGLGRELVNRTRGGAAGGAMSLTEFGNAIIDAWDRYYLDMAAYAATAYDKHFRPIIESESTAKPFEDLVQIVRNAAVKREGRLHLACAAAFKLSRNKDLPLRKISDVCEKQKIKVVSCQLGCFE